jgi:hypothetical protein
MRVWLNVQEEEEEDKFDSNMSPTVFQETIFSKNIENSI